MASLSISWHFTSLSLLILFFRASAVDSNSSFSFPQFGKDPKFSSKLSLYGDAKVVHGDNDDVAVQITGRVSSSAGRVLYKKPIKLVEEGKPQKLVSFSTYFSFALSPGTGNGLAFVMLPTSFSVKTFYNSSYGLPMGFVEKGKSKIVVVKFSTLKDAKNDDLVKLHAGIDVGSFVSTKVRNSSTIDLTLHNGNKSYAWIDYEAGSKRLEVRLSQFGDAKAKPTDPLFWYPIDLSRMWENEEALVGFSSDNKNSSQSCYVYSWRFEQRHVPQWMHSEPLDPKAIAVNSRPMNVEKSKDCRTKILSSMTLGAACGALATFAVLYLWTMFGKKRPVVPEELAVKSQPVDFEYKKVKVVVVDNTIKDGNQ
ncbi:L-type lectin-domain containing receptor kinase VIII.2-like [Humulus lupulus]|uniref:L-type lectin-domain containing receptor kinase VIII.2-like n=1 Tax=Humulus lupulus TaxID=3486 RepID=UPI002B41833B|nr:L-type lectin-domain containing receptor kinase VIII.2-like [Humulus lupulus]